MSRSFYYGSDASMVSGSGNFARLLSLDPGAYGLSVERVEAFAAINETLQLAYQRATRPATRTPVAVSEKNAAVKAMQREAKMIANIIAAQPNVDDGQLIALRLMPRPTRTRRQVPETRPAVSVVGVDGREVTLRIYDSESPTATRKAKNATAALLFAYVGEMPPADPKDYQLMGTFSRVICRVVFPSDVPSGATVWLSARWVTARGQQSLASPGTPFTLQGGMSPGRIGNAVDPHRLAA